VLFEDVCLALENLKPHQMIKIVERLIAKDNISDRRSKYAKTLYLNSKWLNVSRKRNNFNLIGQALRTLFAEGKIHFKNDELTEYKHFIEVEGVEIRQQVVKYLREHVSPFETERFPMALV